jgi:dipeptidyl aminopeptidase/acylaminoacyl peptidase
MTVDLIAVALDDIGGKGRGRACLPGWTGLLRGVRRLWFHDGYRTDSMEHEPRDGKGGTGRPLPTAQFDPPPSSDLASAIAASRVSRSGLHADGGWLYWSESRPDDGGRQVVVGWGPDQVLTDVSPPSVSVRSRVHEYGGAAALVSEGVLIYVDQADQRLFRVVLAEDGPPIPLTTGSAEGPESFRYADGNLTASGHWVVCVEEEHGRESTRHRLVAVATDGSLRKVLLVEADDFVVGPRVSPDGERVAWIGWNHPNMQWDRSEVWVAGLVDTADEVAIFAPHRLAGGADVSVGQVQWSRDGSLRFVSDRSGWWLPYRIPFADLDDSDPVASALVAEEEEFHSPDWTLGQSTMSESADGSVVCRMRKSGRDHLVWLRPPTVQGDQSASDSSPWELTEIDQPCVTITGVATSGGGSTIAVLGSTPTVAAAVYLLTLDDPRPVRVSDANQASAGAGVSLDSVVVARPFVASTPAGPVPGLVYLPREEEIGGDRGALPPLVVFCHGGPTGAVEPGFDPILQFFVGQGLAVASVDYRGSSGHGRSYRRSLQGLWGEADVDDCTRFAIALADAGWVDGWKMAIRGTSAGGLTALGALIRSDRFLGAVSWYGVTDLEMLATETHDFESRYLDGLVGRLPEDIDLYRRRSPVHHPDRVSGAVLLLQGGDDRVVPVGQAERFAQALSSHGVNCRLRIFSGESHGFRNASTIETCLREELAFYRSVLDIEPPRGRQVLRPS